jgi:DNA-binding SARP family transcriptional activator
VDIAILGPLGVRRADGPIAITAHKQRALLVRLLLDVGQPVPVDRLIDDLWGGEPPPGALVSLRAYVSNLRRALDDPTAPGPRLVTRARGYAFDLAPGDELDLHAFEADLRAARAATAAGDHAGALDQLDRALGRWRGDALADVADADFARATIGRFEELRRVAAEDRAAALLALGQHDRAVADLEVLITAEPLRERPHQQLVVALHRAARTPEALEVHRRFRDRLVEELGLEPSPAFDRLAEAVLRRDPRLDLPEPAPASAPEPSPPPRDGPVGSVDLPGVTASADPAAPVAPTDPAAPAGPTAPAGSTTPASPPAEPGAAPNAGPDPTAGPAPTGTGPDHGASPDGSANPATGPAPRAASLPTLLGRDRERAQLRSLVDAAVAGAGGVLLVGGEPGIGKTTLLQEFARVAAPLGGVHWGRCPETRGAPALWPWRTLLGSVVAASDDAALAAAVAAGAAAVGHLVPAVVERTGVLPPLIGDDLAGARFALADATATLLRHLAAPAGLLLLLEDLHWADDASLELWAYVASHAAADRVLFGVTFRDAPADRTPALDASLATVARHPGVAQLHLGGLGPDHVAGLVAEVTGHRPPGEVVDVVVERTAGNPFFVRQLASLLDESDADAATTPVPSGVGHVIARRLQRLDPEVQSLLEVAAVHGRTFDVAVVAAAADAELPQVLEAVDDALAHGLVERIEGSSRRHRFVHALIRETLHDGLSPSRSARLHGAVGTALAATGRARAEELAEHFWLAAARTDEPRALTTAVAAADEAVEVLAYERAELQLRRALELLADPGVRDLDTELAVRTRLVSLLTSVSGWSAPGIVEVASAVADLADRDGLQPAMLTLWHLWWTGVTTRGDLRAGVALSRDLAARAAAEGDELHAAVAQLMLTYDRFHLGELGEETLDELREARERLQRLPSAWVSATPEHLLVTARIAELSALGLLGHRDRALTAAAEAVAVADALDRPFPTVVATMFAAWASAMVDAPEQAHAWSDAGLQRCERFGFRGAAHLLTPVHAWAEVRLGADPTEALARMRAAIVALRALGHLHVLTQWLLLAADVALVGGDHRAAAEELDAASALIEVTGERIYLRQLEALRTRLDATVPADQRAVPDPAAPGAGPPS